MAKELSALALETLKGASIEGNNVKLPLGELDRGAYLEVKTRLELIGGKWKGGKANAFVFNEDPTEYLTALQVGEKRNIKKEFQFFGTPDSLADRLVDLAEITLSHTILEPSAGQGSIVKAIVRQLDQQSTVFGYELRILNQSFLSEIPNLELLGNDFMECSLSFDRIIANPPFNKNQDIDHVSHMYKCLKEGGRLVSIMSKHWQNSSNKKETAFREFLSLVGADIIEVDAGEFKQSGTNIATCIVVIDKN